MSATELRGPNRTYRTGDPSYLAPPPMGGGSFRWTALRVPATPHQCHREGRAVSGISEDLPVKMAT